eukprot:4489293-Prymnesium_polylepis.1
MRQRSDIGAALGHAHHDAEADCAWDRLLFARHCGFVQLGVYDVWQRPNAFWCPELMHDCVVLNVER